jgi:integrase
MAKKIENWTEKNVLDVRPPADKADKADVKVQHPKMSKLAIRFRNGNPVGTYTYYFGLNSRYETIKIGKVGAVTLDFAEKEAIRFEEMISRKVNPNIENAKATADLATPMKDLIEQFLESQKDKKRSANYIKAQRVQLEGDFAGLHTIPIKLIDKPTVIRELDKIKKRGKIGMTRSRATLSKFFNWANERCLCDHNPVNRTEKFQSVARDRVLSPKELAAIWQEAGDDEFGRIIKLLMLTGARRGQIGNLRQDDLHEGDALITLGGQVGIQEANRLAKLGEVANESLSKNRKTFLIPLSTQALAVFAQHPKRANQHLFGTGDGGYDGWDKSIKRLKERLAKRRDAYGREVVKGDWGMHDFRRSFDTLGQDVLKIAPHVTDACINHMGETKKGVRKHYNFAQYLDERIAAMQAWGDYIEKLVKEPEQSRLRLVETAAA